jgi:hypothetical protein
MVDINTKCIKGTCINTSGTLSTVLSIINLNI